MAESPAHKFGQIIGEVIEAAIEPLLRKFAHTHRLFLDKKGPRPARSGRKVSWVDLYGNTHDLDFVLEKGGSPSKIGRPVAFIETAWRRYTKHSRNKAQEIQGAILPLVATHQNAAPFIGVVLAGVFTGGSLTQLRSLGFTVLYFPHETVVQAFRRAGIAAHFDEHTAVAEFIRKVRAWEALSARERQQVAQALVRINSKEIQNFMGTLERVVSRQVAVVRILPLHGKASEWDSVDKAIVFIERYDEGERSQPVLRYEIQIRYTNSDRIEGQFADKQAAIQFLKSYQAPPLRPAS